MAQWTVGRVHEESSGGVGFGNGGAARGCGGVRAGVRLRAAASSGEEKAPLAKELSTRFIGAVGSKKQIAISGQSR